MYFLAAIAWIFGVGSLVLFGGFLWKGSFSLAELRLDGGSVLWWDAALCFVFFLQHSLLVRRSVRRTLTQLIPDWAYGVAYTLTSALALIVLTLGWQRSSVHIYELQGALHWMMRALLLLAFGGFFWGIRSLERFDAFGIEELFAHFRSKRLPDSKLTVQGPYRLVRHPFYAFAIVAIWATPSLSLDRLLFNVLLTGWIVVGARLEERDLFAAYGEEYERYRRTVPMLIPTFGRARTLMHSKVSH